MAEDNFKYFECEIKLDSETASYGPGDMISGHLEIITALPLEFKAINVTYRGDAFVYGVKKGKQHVIDEGRFTEVDHVAHEQYLMVKQNVRGVTTLEPGTHCILLLCVIPITAPSSYYSKDGCVHYSIRVNVEFDDSTKDQSIVKNIKVIAPLDLNSIENVRNPILLKFTKEIGFLQPYPARTLSIGVRVPSSGFSFGQSIPLDVTVSNKTHVRVKRITIALVRRQQYHSDALGIISSKETEIASVKTMSVERYSNRHANTHLNIPQIVSTMAPNLQYCGIIDVDFFLKVTAKIKFITSEVMTSQAKIHIGSVPLSDWHKPSTSDALSLSNFPETYLNPNVNAIYPHLPQNITNDSCPSYFRGANRTHVAVTPSAPPME